MKKQYLNFTLLFALCFLLGFSSCRKEEGDKAVHIDKSDYNTEETVLINEELNNIIASETEVYPILSKTVHVEFYEYVNSLFSSLVNTDVVTNRNDYNWEVIVLNDSIDKNAFITPGGTFYITTGLLNIIESEHELISVMAHEIQYADTGMLIDKLLDKYSGVPLYDIVLGSTAAEAREIAIALRSIKYNELEVLTADTYSMDILCDFLYDPRGMKDFLVRINDEEVIMWAQNRPSSEDRIIQIDNQAGGCGPGSTFTDRYQRYLNMLP